MKKDGIGVGVLRADEKEKRWRDRIGRQGWRLGRRCDPRHHRRPKRRGFGWDGIGLIQSQSELCFDRRRHRLGRVVGIYGRREPKRRRRKGRRTSGSCWEAPLPFGISDLSSDCVSVE